MSHYSSYYARRPRLHGHGRYIFTKGGDAPTENFPLTPGVELPVPSISSTTQKKDPTRGPKMLMILLSIILVVGSIIHYVTIEEAPAVTEVKNARAALENGEDEDGGDGDEGGNSTSVGGKKKTNKKGSLMDTHNFIGGKLALVPPEFSNYADLTDPFLPTDVPFFWHIPRAGGSTVKDITALCMLLTQASQVGGQVEGHEDDTELLVIEDIERGAKFVNVDTVSPEGITHALTLNIASFAPMDLLVSPLLFQISAAFDPQHRGRMFALFRHPVDRAVSMYYYIYSDPKKREMLNGASLEEYARVGPVENNWMTRFLSNAPNGELTAEHEATAREVLRRKCLVGLLTHKAESMARFEAFFGWSVRGEKMEACHERLLIWDWPNKNKHPLIKRGTTVYKLLENYNLFDIRLYQYAEELFFEQARLFRQERPMKRGDGQGDVYQY